MRKIFNTNLLCDKFRFKYFIVVLKNRFEFLKFELRTLAILSDAVFKKMIAIARTRMIHFSRDCNTSETNNLRHN